MAPAEAAVYRLDRLMDISVMPECHDVVGGRFDGGSVMRFAEESKHGDRNSPTSFFQTPQGKLIGLMDEITANPDRHEGNWMERNGIPIPIDNGLAFIRAKRSNSPFALRNEGQTIDPAVLARMKAVTRDQWNDACGPRLNKKRKAIVGRTFRSSVEGGRMASFGKYRLVFNSGSGPAEELGTFTHRGDKVEVYGGEFIHGFAQNGILAPDLDSRLYPRDGQAFWDQLPQTFRNGYIALQPDPESADDESDDSEPEPFEDDEDQYPEEDSGDENGDED